MSMFTTKGRYALRVMSDLACHEGWVSLRDVSERQGISRKYLEQIVSLMRAADLVEGQRGKGGGYRLTRSPKDYTLGLILRAAEGSLSPVDCLNCMTGEICPNIGFCTTAPIWRELGKLISDYLDSHTLDEITDPDLEGTGCIEYGVGESYFLNEKGSKIPHLPSSEEISQLVDLSKFSSSDKPSASKKRVHKSSERSA